jgi:hypothetical protein
VIKIRRLRWLGHFFRIKELDPGRNVTVPKPEGTRLLGKPKLSWPELIEGGLKKMGVRN